MMETRKRGPLSFSSLHIGAWGYGGVRKIYEKMTKWLQSVLCKICPFQSALRFCTSIFSKATFVQFVCKSLILWNLAEQSILILPVCIRAVLSSRYGCFKAKNILFWLQLCLVKKLPEYCLLPLSFGGYNLHKSVGITVPLFSYSLLWQCWAFTK